MKIIDINGKEREALSVKRVSQQIPDALHGGIAATAEYVEVVIHGRVRVWTEWYPLEEFRTANPKVQI